MEFKNKQKKRFKFFTALFISAIMFLNPLVAGLNNNSVNIVFADAVNDLNIEVEEKNEKLDKKVYFSGSVEDEFTSDKVIIVLNENETHKFKNYTPEDFPEIDCVAVKDLTRHVLSDVEQEIQDRKAGIKPKKIKEINVTNFRRILSLELGEKSKENVIKAIRKLEKREEIVSAEPNGIDVASATTPNEATNQQAHYSNQLWLGQTTINAENAWDYETGSATISVGIIDSGIDGDHPDLSGNIDRTSGVHRDFTSGSEVTVIDPTDPATDSHGSLVAGIIGAQGNNTIGMVGMAWDVNLISLRTAVYNSSITACESNVEHVIDAIFYAAGAGIPIINYSAGSYDYYQDYYNAIAAYDGLFVAGAGNDNNNNDTNPFYPASYNLPNIISVGASDGNEDRADWSTTQHPNDQSNYGANSVDVFAPGSGLLSTNKSGGYSYGVSGTSFATPYVAGVAALLMSMKSDMEPIDIKNCILYSSDTDEELGPYRDTGATSTYNISNVCVTGGRLDAYEALKVADEMWDQPTWSSNTDANGTITANSYITGREPYGAFDGYAGSVSGGTTSQPTNHPATQWTASGTTGWLELELNEYIEVSRIYFYNRSSGGGHHTKDAFFTGTSGVALGEAFTGEDESYGLSIIEVDNIVTDVIKLTITSSYGSYIGANEIRIVGKPTTAPTWERPNFTANYMSGVGVAYANSYYGSRQPYGAFDGWVGDATQGLAEGYSAAQWTSKTTQGWLEVDLTQYVSISEIHFYNRQSSASEFTKDAFFTGRRGVALGEKFTAKAESFGLTVIELEEPIVTDIIRLNVLSSHGSSYIGAGEIAIIGTPASEPDWTAPTWHDSNSNSWGSVTASGSTTTRQPYGAFDGWIGDVNLGADAHYHACQWSVKATSGYIELNLNQYVYISEIHFYNRQSGGMGFTKNAYFTGSGGTALGSSFTALGESFGLSVIDVNDVYTNKIRLNITSSYGTYIGAGEIVIIGTTIAP